MPHYIHLRNLKFHAFHGVMPQERTVGNHYVVNLSAEYPIEQAMENDDLAHTLNYAEVYAVVENEMKTPYSKMWLIALPKSCLKTSL